MRDASLRRPEGKEQQLRFPRLSACSSETSGLEFRAPEVRREDEKCCFFLWVGKTTPSLLPQLDLLVSWTTIVLSCVRLCSVILLRVHVGASHSGCRPEMLRRKGHQTDARCQNAKRGEEKRLGLSRPISPG